MAIALLDQHPGRIFENIAQVARVTVAELLALDKANRSNCKIDRLAQLLDARDGQGARRTRDDTHGGSSIVVSGAITGAVFGSWPCAANANREADSVNAPPIETRDMDYPSDLNRPAAVLRPSAAAVLSEGGWGCARVRFDDGRTAGRGNLESLLADKDGFRRECDPQCAAWRRVEGMGHDHA